MKELTRAEEQIMQYVWRIKKGFLKDIVEQFPEPKPAYTTVSTVVRVLVEKGYINFNSYGKLHEYYPAIGKIEYAKTFFQKWKTKFFHSNKTFASFFMNENNMSISELEELQKLVEETIKSRNRKA